MAWCDPRIGVRTISPRPHLFRRQLACPTPALYPMLSIAGRTRDSPLVLPRQRRRLLPQVRVGLDADHKEAAVFTKGSWNLTRLSPSAQFCSDGTSSNQCSKADLKREEVAQLHCPAEFGVRRRALHHAVERGWVVTEVDDPCPTRVGTLSER